MIKLLGTILPSLVLVYFFVTQDRFPEPKKYIFITFFLGILICFPAGYLNSYVLDYLTYIFAYSSWDLEIENFYYLRALIPGAGVEETLKLCILIFFCSRFSSFDEPMDGLVYGATAALGFAMYENFGYVNNADYYGTTWENIAWIRAVLTAPMHACCGAILGFSLSYFYFFKRNYLIILIGWITAILFHAIFNYSAFAGIPLLGEIVLIIQIIIVLLILRNLKKRQAMHEKILDNLYD